MVDMKTLVKTFALAALVASSASLFSCKSMIANKLGDAAAGSDKKGAAIPKKATLPT